MRFTVWIAGYSKTPHVRAFEDFAAGLAAALRRLDNEVEFSPGRALPQRPGRLIVFGAHLLSGVELPPDAIIYNAEQIGEAPLSAEYHRLLQRHVVWDYSRENIRRLNVMGLGAQLCRVGYVPEMTKTWPEVEQGIDVLHYGSVNARRKEVLEAVADAGLHLEHAFGVYGPERDALIRRAKVVLNLHFYDRPIFEIFRVSHLLANGKCVVSEDGGADADLEALARHAVVLAPRERLVAECQRLVADAEARQKQAETGLAEFAKVDLVDEIRRALLC